MRIEAVAVFRVVARVVIGLGMVGLCSSFAWASSGADEVGALGYYRQPVVHGDTIVFVAEGDLWTVGIDGGLASRLTSHPGPESHPAISPDGRWVAYLATYEGPAEVYLLPLRGGRARRLTWEAGRRAAVVGWTPEGEVLYTTRAFSGLPNNELVRLRLDPGGSVVGRERVPLAQAADGDYTADGKTLVFTRLPFQGSHAKRYRGGTAQQLWRFDLGASEAVPLTADYPGTSRDPMIRDGRVWFTSDRDGTMNLWSMDLEGRDLRQHTDHEGWDVLEPSLHSGRVVYRLAADLRVHDIRDATDRALSVRLATDLDHMRTRWVEKPLEWISAMHPSHDGSKIAITARGKVFVAPRGPGRWVEATPEGGVRYRAARFLPEGDRLAVLSDRTGEVEVWEIPADGIGERVQRTSGAEVLRWEVLPSPDGRYLAHRDKNFRLWVTDRETGETVRVAESEVADLGDLAWSPDSRWLAFTEALPNLFRQVRLWSREDGAVVTATTDRYDGYSPAWSRDGQWLYFLSDRHLVSKVSAPWGTYQPEPFLDETTEVFVLSLRAGERSPWAPDTELTAAESDAGDGADHAGAQGAEEDEAVEVVIDVPGLETRLDRVPVPPGNYTALSAVDGGLLWIARGAAGEGPARLVGAEVRRHDVEVETLATGIGGYEVTGDGKRLMIVEDSRPYVVPMEIAERKLDDDAAVDLSSFKLAVQPTEEWRQMALEAWRLHRDYFYDPDMHGVDWPAMRDKYLPLVDRVTDRAELSDVIAQMVSELSALHTVVRGGDRRVGEDDVRPARLGARLERVEDGFVVEHVYRSDPDRPELRSPLAAPGIDVIAGDVIAMIDGVETRDVADVGTLLRGKAGVQVRLRVRSSATDSTRDVVVEPLSTAQEADLRYHEWELTRRERVERATDGRVGYVHLRAMGTSNWTEWARGFYPVFRREGLIVDARNNRGGNIDSWILSRLVRKAWMAWSQRVGDPGWTNMQYAFRGHLVVLCNEWTASDGEAFVEGFRRLGLGPVIGTRTWGGEIWLTASNVLVDRGIATAAEFGVYGPEGEWLIEGWGVEPDIVVDNLPHATFNGEDAQLEAAIDYLERKIEEEPIAPFDPPPHPDKSAKPGS